MAAVGQLGQVADRLGSLGGLAERRFAAIGHSLEQAVGILAALTATFQTLLTDLRGGELALSGQDLASDDGPDAAPARIAASYTMARERVVHARFAPLETGLLVDTSGPAMADAALADMPF